MITLGTSLTTPRMIANVSACLNKNELGRGEFIAKFEHKAAEYTGMKYGIATCNGSMADIVALAALKNLNPSATEVIVPSLTFVAHVNSVVFNGLIPVFVDVDYDYQISVPEIEKAVSSKTLAIMPAHLLGKKCKIERIMRIAKRHYLPVMEDSCEAFGIKPQQTGTYSFYPSHVITTGEGGMIVTNDDKLAGLSRKLRNHGRKSDNIPDKFHFDILGFNGKMNNVTASIGEAAIEKADEIIERRRRNVETLNEATGQDWYAESPHCYPMMLDSEEERDEKLKRLEKEGIEGRKIFSSLPTQEMLYKNENYRLVGCRRAEIIGKRGLYVPCHQNLTDKQIRKISQNISNE